MLAGTKAAIAVTWVGKRLPERWSRACAVLGAPGEQELSLTEHSAVCVVGADEGDVVDAAFGTVLLRLTRGARIDNRDVTNGDVTAWLSTDRRHPALDQVVPPFAALHRPSPTEPIRVGTDYLGFRSMYVASGDGWAAVATSSKALAVLAGASLDHESLAYFSLIGWQIGNHTHFAGVKKLVPGALVVLRDGAIEISSTQAKPESEPYSRLSDAVTDAADLIRTAVNSMLDDHPDTWLQLTGGLDSRILLGAIDLGRRSGLHAMTLEAPGNPDADMAASLASRFGMQHHIIHVSDVHTLCHERALELALIGAHRLDYSADPLAWAALALAEGSLKQNPRLTGLGGEVVRGFYYLGPVLPVRVNRRRIAGLARWRLFPNESVPDEVLAPDFVASRRESTFAELFRIFEDLPAQWNQATDAFYLWQRMQRWAGVTTTSTVQDRLAVNVMLDPRFLAIGHRVPPRWKAGMRFLSSLMCELDSDLARLPLDGRPAPEVYAKPTLSNRARLWALTARKVRRKVSQRLSSSTRPAVGGVTIADLVVRHWASDPSILEPVANTGILRREWLDKVLAGAVSSSASSIGFVVTLAAACSAPKNSDPP